MGEAEQEGMSYSDVDRNKIKGETRTSAPPLGERSQDGSRLWELAVRGKLAIITSLFKVIVGAGDREWWGSAGGNS